MIDRRQSLALLGALLASGGKAISATVAQAAGVPFSWSWLRSEAARRARRPLLPLPAVDTRADAIDYDVSSRISFKPERTIFADSAYPVRLFPLSRYASTPISISVVERGLARVIEHSADMFTLGPGAGEQPAIPAGLSGFRVTNTSLPGDWLAFQGASYFRSAGALGQYGLSARGIAIDTGTGGAEEFPAFTHFWIERGGDALIVYALLEGPSVVGAYRFVNSKMEEVVQDISMVVWLRRDVQRLGIAPLTSMFWYDEGNPEKRADWRPEIHDSDGLLIHNSSGEQLWRPLANPGRPTLNSFLDAHGTSSFGLLQRDRSFDHYQDDGVFYERRPSLWVEARGDWGPGAVMLYEIPTAGETDDNIVAFWTPARPARAGSSFAFDYRLRWMAGEPSTSRLARVVDRWTGTAGRPGHPPVAGARRLVADFAGESLAGLDRTSGVRAQVTVDAGETLLAEAYPVVGQNARWRLVVDVRRDGRPTNVRAALLRGATPMTETLIQQFA